MVHDLVAPPVADGGGLKTSARLIFLEELPCISAFCFQASGSDMTVIAFLIFPAKTNNFNVESLRGQAIAKQLRETAAVVQRDIGHRLFEICLRSVTGLTGFHITLFILCVQSLFTHLPSYKIKKYECNSI